MFILLVKLNYCLSLIRCNFLYLPTTRQGFSNYTLLRPVFIRITVIITFISTKKHHNIAPNFIFYIFKIMYFI